VSVALTWDTVRAWRVSRHHLDARAPKRRLLAVVADVCGLHAQVQSSAELQLWARVDDVTAKDVRAALWKRRTLVRSWAMRGTLHLLPAREFALYVAALSTVDRWWKGAWLRMVGLSADELRLLLDVVRESLSDEPVTREELTDRVAGRVGPHVREHMLSGWGSLLKPAAFQGSLCSGPPRGQTVTFVRPDLWIGRWEEHDGTEAWREVLRRYLHTYGPSGHEEFAAWWGVAPAPARRLRVSVEDELEEVSVEGTAAWALAKDARSIAGAGPAEGVRLLPHFDPYVMGFRPREALVDRRFAGRVFRKAGWVSPVVLADGRIAGVWGYERAGRGVEVAVEPFGKPSAALRAGVREEADRLGAFLGAPVRLSVAPPAGTAGRGR
jgi:uncharacterized protein YcaQ